MNLTESLLWPFTLPYGAGTRLRAAAYQTGLLRRKRLNARVVSVGNLTVGGTGKTPMVLWIAQRLVAEGKKAGILTRGYHGRPGPIGRTSDEVELLRARLGSDVAFGVGADRHVSGSVLVNQGVDWFVLDDGFQHLQLARDADVVLIDATNPFGGGRLLPAGRMREPKTALGRADVIVVTRSCRAPAVEAAVRRETSVPIFYAQPRLESVRWVDRQGSGEEVAGALERKWFAFCGVGNPGAFMADLREWGFRVAGPRLFADHHFYTRADVDELVRQARETGADGLLCTEKDRCNLSGVPDLPLQTAYCRISLEVNRADAFWGEIETVVAISKSKVF